MGRASGNVRIPWEREPNLVKLAGVCEFYFEWGYKEAIVKRFRTVIWRSIVLRILRRAVLCLDLAKSKANVPTTPKKKNETPSGTPSKMITKHFSSESSLGLNSPTTGLGSESDEENEGHRLIVKVHAYRRHPSTDGLPEYRLEIAPKQLVQLTESGIKGLRVPEGRDEWASEDAEDGEHGGKKDKRVPVDSETHLRLWMPACMVKLVQPDLVESYEALQENKTLHKAAKGTQNALSEEKAPEKKKKLVAQDVCSEPSKKLNAKKTTSIASFFLPSLTDETRSELEGNRGSIEPILLVWKQRLSPPEDPDEFDAFLSRGPDIRATGASQAGSSKPPVREKPWAATRDLTRKNKLSTSPKMENALKSFFPVTHSSSHSTKKTFIQKPCDIDRIVPLSPLKRKKRNNTDASAESDLSDYIKESPRKRFTKTSPHAGTVAIPSKPQVKKSMDIIEISSDSDSDQGNLQPLLRTKTCLPEDKPRIFIDLT